MILVKKQKFDESTKVSQRNRGVAKCTGAVDVLQDMQDVVAIIKQ